MFQIPYLKLVLALSPIFMLLVQPNAHAQTLEPRAYSNAPIGMNFLLIGYGYAEGGLFFDPSTLITDANAKTDIGLFAFAQTFAVAGQSAKYAVILPYARLDADGYLNGQYRQREVSGLADPTFAVTVNLSGAPALATLDEFKHYQQDTIIGATLKVTAPLGQYDDDKLLNIGTNRWSLKPEMGISQSLGNWIVEGAAAVTLYSTNNDFFGGQKLEQDPIYSAQGHLVYNFPRGLWVALDATYYTGGQTAVDGVKTDNELKNWRFGATLALPLNKKNSIKLDASTGISTRTGSDFDTVLLAWQHRWGAGL